MKSRNVFLTSILGIWAVNFAAWGAGFTVASTDYVDAVVENAAAPMVKHTANTAAGSETVPVYIAADGTATPITAYSGNAATATTATTATRATADADGNVITTTYATKSELETTNSNVTANANAIAAINNVETGILKTANDYTDTQLAAITTGDSSIATRVATAESDIDALESGKQDVITDLSTIRSGAAAGATALQPADITTGGQNGTISVDGTNVPVAGLKSAAFTDATAYITVPVASGVGKQVLTFDGDTGAYYWESIGR